MARLSYFTKDGNYGDADGITVVDTTEWESSDFDLVEQASDDMRPLAARIVSDWIENGRDDSADGHFDRLGIDKTSR